MVGRSTGGEQTHGGVHDGPLVDAAPQRTIIRATVADGRQTVDTRAGELLA